MKLETQCLHAGSLPSPVTDSRTNREHRTSSIAGDAKSFGIDPATVTHSQLVVQQQANAGVIPESARFTLGKELIIDKFGKDLAAAA